MIKINPLDGEAKIVLHPSVDLLQLLQDSEETAVQMGYTHNMRCFCNYLIAHYAGYWNVTHTKFYVSFPLILL